MDKKTFNIVSIVAIAVATVALIICLIGWFNTGFFPGLPIIAFFQLGLVLIRRHVLKSETENNIGLFTAGNVIVLLIILWMSFVILHDRVFMDQ